VRILFENWRKFLKEDELIEKLYKALGEDNQKVFKALTTEQQLDLARQWEQAGMPGSLLSEAITIDIDVGDIVLGGKYKNKRMTVKEIGKDELGQPTVNGKPILKFRTEKHLPDNKKSKKTLDAEKEEKEKLDEQGSGLPPGFQGFDVEEPDEPVGSTAGMREIERNFGTYASESQASRYLKPAALALLKRYGDGRESIQIYEKGNVLGWAVELSKVTDASTAKVIGQKIKKNLWGKRSPKLTSKQWHLHDLPMWVAYDEGAERIEAPKPPPPRQGTLFENWRGYLNEEDSKPPEGWEKFRTDFIEELFSVPSVQSDPYTAETFANFPNEDWRGEDEVYEGGDIKEYFAGFVHRMPQPTWENYGEFGKLIHNPDTECVSRYCRVTALVDKYFPEVESYIRSFGKNLQGLDDEQIQKLIKLFISGEWTEMAYDTARSAAG
jgi:hypothetical protein